MSNVDELIDIPESLSSNNEIINIPTTVDLDNDELIDIPSSLSNNELIYVPETLGCDNAQYNPIQYNINSRVSTSGCGSLSANTQNCSDLTMSDGEGSGCDSSCQCDKQNNQGCTSGQTPSCTSCVSGQTPSCCDGCDSGACITCNICISGDNPCDIGCEFGCNDCNICISGDTPPPCTSCDSCECSAESNQGCTDCQDYNSPSSCTTGCQVTTQCTTGCEVTTQCTTGCQITAQCYTGCEIICQFACQFCEAACELASQRPSSWSWTSTVKQGSAASSGGSAYLTAVEWNNFTARINEFRSYKNLSTISFVAAVKGQPMTAAQVNVARSAINDMKPSTAVPAAVVKGTAVTAAFINGLKNSLNSIT